MEEYRKVARALRFFTKLGIEPEEVEAYENLKESIWTLHSKAMQLQAERNRLWEEMEFRK